MAFSIEYNKLKQMKMLNENTSKIRRGGDIFIENEETLLKAVTINTKHQIEYLSTLPEHEHVIKPLEVGNVLYSDNIPEEEYSTIYRMKYLQNAKTFLSLLYNKEILYDEKVQFANELFSALHFLHQYIVLGDIHAKNIWIKNKKAYLGNLDNSKKINNIFPKKASYYLGNLAKFEHSKRTDIIKLYIECLSFIANVNLSSYIDKYGYTNFCKTAIGYNLPKEVIEFLYTSKNKKEFKKLGNDAYQFENFISSDALKLEKTLSFMDPYKK